MAKTSFFLRLIDCFVHIFCLLAVSFIITDGIIIITGAETSHLKPVKQTVERQGVVAGMKEKKKEREKNRVWGL